MSLITELSLDLGVLEQLLCPLHLPGAVADKRTPIAGQIP
jgi:hypothetical protein